METSEHDVTSLAIQEKKTDHLPGPKISESSAICHHPSAQTKTFFDLFLCQECLLRLIHATIQDLVQKQFHHGDSTFFGSSSAQNQCGKWLNTSSSNLQENNNKYKHILFCYFCSHLCNVIKHLPPPKKNTRHLVIYSIFLGGWSTTLAHISSIDMRLTSTAGACARTAGVRQIHLNSPKLKKKLRVRG